jgi:hypothetical protein
LPVSRSKVAGRSDRVGRVVVAGEARDEQRDYLIPDDLGHDAVPPVHDPSRGSIEAGDQPRKVLYGNPLRQRGGAPNVGEQHGDLDLGPAGVFEHLPDAPFADAAVERGRAPTEKSHDDASGGAERSRAEFAPR